MTVRTMNLTMTDDYPGPRFQVVSGYKTLRLQGPFIVFEVEGENEEHIYFKHEHIFEMVSTKGKL